MEIYLFLIDNESRKKKKNENIKKLKNKRGIPGHVFHADQKNVSARSDDFRSILVPLSHSL